MEDTVQVEKEDATQNQSSNNDPMSMYLKSKELVDNYDIPISDVRIETRLIPDEWHSEFRRKRRETNNLHNNENELTREDINFTMTTLAPELKTDISIPDSVRILSPDSLKHNEKIAVVSKDSQQVAYCDTKHDVVVEYENPIGEDSTIRKPFNSYSEAQQVKEEIADITQDAMLTYDENNQVKIVQEYEGISEILSEVIKEQGFGFEITIASVWTVLAFSVYGLVAVGVSLGTLGIIVMASTIIASIVVDYKHKYEFQKEAESGVPITSTSVINTENTVTVESHVEDGKLVLDADEIDARWEFNNEGNILSKQAVQFFNQAGTQPLSDGKDIMIVQRTETEHSVESISGKWHLLPTI